MRESRARIESSDGQAAMFQWVTDFEGSAGNVCTQAPREVFNDDALRRIRGRDAHREPKRDKKRVSKCQHDLRTYARAYTVVRSATIRTWPSTRDAHFSPRISRSSP